MMIRINNLKSTKASKNNIEQSSSTNSEFLSPGTRLSTIINVSNPDELDKNSVNVLHKLLKEDRVEEDLEEEEEDDDGDAATAVVAEDEEEDEEEEEDQEEDDQDDENIHPISVVQVKYAVNYDYDEKKFKLIQGEKLNLYEKTNEDWWLCSHMENTSSKFFVPASYVKDLVEKKYNIKPPPRPPPPPIDVIKQLSVGESKQETTDKPPPMVKPRQNKNIILNSNINEEIYENLADLTIYPNETTNENSPTKVINELDECLNNQQFSFDQNVNNSPLKQQNNKTLSSNDTSTTTIGTSTTTTTINTTTTPEPDYDEDQHIYQNLPLKPVSPSTNQDQSNKLNSSKKVEIDETYGHLGDAIEASPSSNNNQRPAENNILNPNDKDNDYEDGDDDDEYDDEENYNEEEEEEDYNDEAVGLDLEDTDDQNHQEQDVLNHKKEEENFEIPEGWKCGISNCKRKFFYNNINKDRWYLNFDPSGKYYFYNGNNQSVWELPKLYKNSQNEYEYDEDIDYGLDDKEKSAHFKRDFDSDLPTFKNLYSRLSTRKQPNNSNTSSNANENNKNNSSNTTLNTSALANTSIASSNAKEQALGATSIASMNTKISYSHKPPSDLSNNFKCIVLAKNGKRVRKKNSENYKVILIRTKIGFVKEGKSHPKMEFSLDFKGGKCYKILKSSPNSLNNNSNNSLVNSSNIMSNNKSSSSMSPASSNAKDSNNNINVKDSKEKFKENAEIIVMVGNKHAFIIETTNGYKILIISDSETIVDEWIYAINSIITQFQSEFSPIYEGPELLHSTQKVTDSDINKFTASTSAAAASLMSSPHHIKQIQQLSDSSNVNLINNVNSKNKKKECVFGSNLINLSKKERKNVPTFVEEIINMIETKGLDMDGIYRISGNLVEVQKVRHMVDHGKLNFKDFDIHVLSGALKTFFRELEDPLIPYHLHQYFLDAMKIQDRNKRFIYVHELIKKMPISHRETLRYLLAHLLKVVVLSKENRMNVQNIALVFGPNIMRSNPLNDGNFGFNPNIMTQNMIVEYLLNNFKEIYSFQTNSIFTEYTNN